MSNVLSEGKQQQVIALGKLGCPSLRFGNYLRVNIERDRGVAFMIFRKRFTARVFLNFLGRVLRLTRKTRRKLFLIVNAHPVHKSTSVSRWLAEHAAQIRIFCLPSYSPELNLDELLNQDVKTNALDRIRPRNVLEMMDNVRSYLRITQAKPKLVKNYFCERHVQYSRQLKSVINLVLGILTK
jgi:hypothetical protein